MVVGRRAAIIRIVVGHYERTQPYSKHSNYFANIKWFMFALEKIQQCNRNFYKWGVLLIRSIE